MFYNNLSCQKPLMSVLIHKLKVLTSTIEHLFITVKYEVFCTGVCKNC